MENKKGFTRTHVSFQSTGATNIAGVNNLPSLSFYVSVKGRSRGATRRLWGIEQNEARQLYLGTYYGVDNVDHMIKIAKIRYICWKYWHAPVNHCFSIAVIAAYDMYNECCDGDLDPEWAIPENERMSFSKFRQTMSKQMLAYNPVLEHYPGDNRFRTVTSMKKTERASIKSSNSSILPTIMENEPLMQAFVKAKTPVVRDSVVSWTIFSSTWHQLRRSHGQDLVRCVATRHHGSARYVKSGCVLTRTRNGTVQNVRLDSTMIPFLGWPNAITGTRV